MTDRTRRIWNSLENLENRVLFATINVADFGAAPGDGRDDHRAITRAIARAAPGDTVVFDAGQYDIGHTLELRTGVAYRGAGERDTRLRFLVGQDGWGMTLQSGADDVTVENLVLDGGGVAMKSGDGFENVTVRNNEFVNTPRGTFNNNGPAVFAGARSDGLTITGNHIHGSDKYGLILYAVDRLTVANNTFEDLMQAGHIMDLGEDNTVSFNRLTGMVRMGFELQRHGERTATNTTVEGNVITDWRNPFRDSFGLSIVPDGSVNTRVINNYIQGVPRGWDGEWNHIVTRDDDVKRMGYGIEYGARSGEVSGNVIGGAFANHVIVSGGGGKHDGVIAVEDNAFYGTPVWHDWVTQESHGGAGFGWTDEGNVKDGDFDAMPEPPRGGLGRDDRVVRGRSQRPEWQHGEFTWLSNLTPDRADSAWGPVETDQSNGGPDARDGRTMTINGREYEKGLGVAGESEVVFDLGAAYEKFFAHIGVDDAAGDEGSVTVEVWADGERIFESGLLTGAMTSEALALDVAGVRELKLVTTDGGDGPGSDHANWAGAKLVNA